MNPSSAAGFDLFVPQRRDSGRAAALLALLTGGLQAASLAWPSLLVEALGGIGPLRGQALWWLQLLALAALVLLLQGSVSARQAAWRGWLFALAWLACTFAWLFTSMHTYGGLAAPLAVLAVLALAGVLALYVAGACWCFKRLAPAGAFGAVACFAALWLLAELARGVLFTGFGWGAIGYAQIDGPLASLIGWVGLYGLSAAAAALAALLAFIVLALARKATWRETGALAVAMLVALLASHFVPAPQGSPAGTLDVTLLQGNIAQDEKFESGTGVPKALRWYGEQLQASTGALVITPETALPVLPEQLPDGYWAALARRFAGGEQAALVGVPLGSYAEGYTNSVVGFRPGQATPWRYDKHHLVPFGEFIPPMFRWFTDLMSIPLGDFNRGALPQPTFDWQGQRLAATICYENLFSEELAAQFGNPATAPTIFFNVSNLGWFGEHLAMDQHLQIARMRTLEFDRPFLLATNTGLTAFVDHQARVVHTAPAHAAQALRAEVQGRLGLTPYAAWVSRWGLWPLLVLSLSVLVVARRRA